jgi:hypothetical protein
MRNDLTEFELNWLFELAMNGDAAVPPALLKRLRELGYAKQVFSQTQATDLGRERLLARARSDRAPHANA